MKAETSRFVVAAVITGLLLIAGNTSAWAQSPNFPNFSSVANLSLNGNAAQNTTVLELTPPSGSQRGSAWFNVQQPVQNGFTTTFSFRITPAQNSGTTADGIAFVLQNSAAATTALGDGGGGIGYQGITNSIAVEFDTFLNGPYDPNNNHVAVQSCGTAANSSDHNAFSGANHPCKLAINSELTFPNGDSTTTIQLANGISHTATITYTPCTGTGCLGSLTVVLDGHDLFPGGVLVDLGTIGLASGNAWAGFTAGTGAFWETHDILSWTFQSQVPAGETTVFQFNNNNYLVTPDAGSPTATIQVTPILTTQAACNALVQANPLFVTPLVPGQTAQCFLYKDAGGPGADRSVMYEVICPPSSPGCTPFEAELGSTYDITVANNPGFNTGNPFPGWLKGDSEVNGHPCAAPAAGSFLFDSNQVSSFDLLASDPVTKGRSGGTASCWVATYNTPHEAPTVTITTPGNGANYALLAPVNADFNCVVVDKGPSSSEGPYLAQKSCSATNTYTTTSGPKTDNVANGNPIDTATPGPHTFTATVVDSATDNASQTVTYNVVTPADLAILKLAPLLVRAGGTVTYSIGVGNLGGSNAVGVVVSDVLPADTTLVGSPTGNNVSCAIVNRKLTCTTTAMFCTAGPTVTCSSQAPIAPLSLSSLNGATVKITVKLGSTWTAGKVVKNTANVTSTNTDPKPNNNNSTAATLVTR